jgi:hypothetical protein
MLRAVAATAIAGLLSWVLVACGGGTTTVTTTTGGGLNGATDGPVVAITEPSGTNTTEIVVDNGPPELFSLGVVNLPYVTVTVCSPGDASRCVSIDHVLLDTGSMGLRVLGTQVAGLNLPGLQLPADAGTGTPAGQAMECYPFVVGAIWGPVVRADVKLAGETGANLPVQLIDDSAAPTFGAPQNCLDAADQALIRSMGTLQAKGILGIGMTRYDCGQRCVADTVASDLGFVQYYSCAVGRCTPSRMASDLQIQNPIAHFAANNNGSVIVMPAVPDLGASLVRGRLVLGIGTQANNQLAASSQVYQVDTDPMSVGYLGVVTQVNGRRYDYSYFDTGTNGLFFEDTSLSRSCPLLSSQVQPWYCPDTLQQRSATLVDGGGFTGTTSFNVASAQVLFNTSNVAFNDLGGFSGSHTNVFVWGMPFYYGRSVYTAIWGQPLAERGPWWAF